MAKRRRAPAKKKQSTLSGCLSLIFLVGICGIIVSVFNPSNDEADPTATPSIRQRSPTEVAAEPTAPNTELPTPEPFQESTALALVAEPTALYAQVDVDVRICPEVNCQSVGILVRGTRSIPEGVEHGEAIDGNDVWFKLSFRGGIMYAHSRYFATTPPDENSAPQNALAPATAVFTLPPAPPPTTLPQIAPPTVARVRALDQAFRGLGLWRRPLQLR
ncbi:MAG: hypothetical protein IPK19_16505 [Chloroflexi bacterium]|nr:hypothetical protein [Chloroflexota bacterium]